MPSRNQVRTRNRRRAQRSRREASLKPVLQGVTQKILLEDLHKLVDPYFFKEPKFAITQNIFDALYSKGVRTVGDVTQKTEAELLELPGIGVARLKKIKEALDHLGLALKV